MYMNRKLAKEVGQETVEILAKGRYRNLQGDMVFLAHDLEQMVEGTLSYPPEESLPHVSPGEKTTRFEVINDTTLEAARALTAAGYNVAALNFASAKNPGGGFLGGSRAQEESLARSSGLYVSIKDQPMYSYHRSQRDCMYSNYAIYSPRVPVFRSDQGELLEEPYFCAMITSPAVNAGVVLKRRQSTRSKIKAEMRKRVEKVLTLAAIHEHDALVLGAWGCGVFQNSAEDIASLFDEALLTNFKGVFARVTFAILDSSREQRFIGPFLQHFGESTIAMP